MGTNERDICSVIEKLPNYSKLLIMLYKSPDIRKRQKLLLSAGIAYSVSPVELIPGIIPVAGQLDNLIIMLRCLRKVLKSSDEKVRERYLKESGITLEEIDEDIKISADTLKSIGRGTVRIVSNTGKFAGYSVMRHIKEYKNRRIIKNR
ncbi:MAG TPA: YkvA family protein [Bacillota bacterium]|nr:YkvA family protein [Bacillota bacterium]HQE66040.1 YkvA family protein [Bacillota bacterium]